MLAILRRLNSASTYLFNSQSTITQNHQNNELNSRNSSTSSTTFNETHDPKPYCTICQSEVVSICHSDSCLHDFCFPCLFKWSQVKAECPLCKIKFEKIIYSIRSETDYKEYTVTPMDKFLLRLLAALKKNGEVELETIEELLENLHIEFLSKRHVSSSTEIIARQEAVNANVIQPNIVALEPDPSTSLRKMYGHLLPQLMFFVFIMIFCMIIQLRPFKKFPDIQKTLPYLIRVAILSPVPCAILFALYCLYILFQLTIQTIQLFFDNQLDSIFHTNIVLQAQTITFGCICGLVAFKLTVSDALMTTGVTGVVLIALTILSFKIKYKLSEKEMDFANARNILMSALITVSFVLSHELIEFSPYVLLNFGINFVFLYFCSNIGLVMLLDFFHSSQELVNEKMVCGNGFIRKAMSHYHYIVIFYILMLVFSHYIDVIKQQKCQEIIF